MPSSSSGKSLSVQDVNAPMEVAPSKISLVIPTFNRPEGLIRVLDSIWAQDNPPVLVVVVDDSPEMDSEMSLMKWRNSHDTRFEIIYIHNEIRAGIGASRNIGGRQCRSTFISFTDDDCVMHPQCLGNLQRALEATPADVAGVGGSKYPISTMGMINRYYKACSNTRDKRSLDTSNCCIKKEIFDEVGGFDEMLTTFTEDTAISIKMILKGYRFISSPDAIVFHDWPEDLVDFRSKARQYGRGERAMLDHYFGEGTSKEDIENMRRAGWTKRNMSNTPSGPLAILSNGMWQIKIWLRNGTPIRDIPQLFYLWFIYIRERKVGWRSWDDQPSR